MESRVLGWWAAALIVALVAGGAERLDAQSDGSLTLAEALVRARASSPQLRRAREAAAGLGAALEAFAPLDNPALEVRTENWGTASSASGVLVDTFIVGSQPLPLGGRRRAARDVLAAESETATQLVSPSQLVLDLDVARRYIDVVTARDQLGQLDAQVDALTELHRIVESRASAGAGATSEAARLKAELVRVDLLRMQARVELARNAAALAARLGESSSLDLSRLIAPPLAPLPAGSPDSLVAMLVANHPTVVDARARLETVRRRVRFEAAVGRVQATAIGGYKRTSGISTGVAALVVSLPVFDTNAPAKIRAASDERIAGLMVVEAERVARAEMTALVEVADQLARGLRATADLESLDTVRTAARARLRESATDVLGVVDAERLWHDTRRERRVLQRDALYASYELRLRLGLEIQP